KSKYDNLDLEVTFHNFPYYNNSNVIAIQYGTELPDEYIVCGAHYDSKTWNPPNPEVAPGADDNATGTAGIMEIAKILSQYDFKRSIIYCAFSGEEYGLYGSDYYAQQCASQGMDILGYFNIDMSGYLNPNASNITISIIRPAMAAPLDDYYTNVANIYFPQVNITHHASMYGDSDHSSFCTNGYQGIYPFENNDSYSPYIHTPNDIIGVSVNNQEQVRVYTQVSLACIATLAVLADSIISPPPTPLPILALSKTSSSVEVFNEETVDDYITVYNLGDTTLTFEIRDIVIECGTYDGKLINIEPVEGMVESGDSLIITLSYFFPLLVKTVDFEYLGSFIFICNDSTQLETEISLHALAHQSESINEAMISKIKIYPNPANNELRVTSSNNKEINPLVIEIYDVYGRKIMAKFPSNKLEGWQSKADGVVFDISHLTSGVYFIKIANEWVGKFIKQ
ncbi:MAG: M28 family peptidase, partial [Lentimicrobiaceae bacterium]|nr:M28 family peptidase [Lentimicrobiaceae bacterium]